MKSTILVSYRTIAKMLSSALPVEGDDFAYQVECHLEAIKRLPVEAKHALKVAYIFSRKVPRHEREDLFQDIALAVLKVKTPDEKLAYAIARCDWRNWWEKRFVRQDKVCLLNGLPKPQNHSTCKFKHKPKECCECPYRAFRQMEKSLDSITEDEEGNPVTLAETIVGEVEFENKMNGKLDAHRIWNKLPKNIQPLVFKRLIGQALTHYERTVMSRYVNKFGYQLLLAQ